MLLSTTQKFPVSVYVGEGACETYNSFLTDKYRTFQCNVDTETKKEMKQTQSILFGIKLSSILMQNIAKMNTISYQMNLFAAAKKKQQ